MAIKPTKPTVPPAPQRSMPSTFSALADVFVAFISTLVAYIDAALTFVDETADDVAINAVLPAAQLWATATSYSVNDVVEESGLYYKAIVAHTSGTFVTDRDTNGYWELIGAERFDVNANTLVATAGTGNDYTITAAETITTYATGQRFLIRADRANTGASTLNVDSVGATAIQRYDSAGVLQDLVADEIQQGEIHQVTYDGTRFVLISLPLREVTKVIGLVPIVTKTASTSSELEFTEFDADLYDGYIFEGVSVIPDTTVTALQVRTSTDGGTSYDSGASDYAYGLQIMDMVAATSPEYSNQAAATSIVITDGTGAGDDPQTGFDGVGFSLKLRAPHLARDTMMSWTCEYDTGTEYRTGVGAGVRLASEDVDAIEFSYSSGNIGSGSITMYGIRKPS